MAPVSDRQASSRAQSRRIRRAHRAARGHLQKSALKLLGWAVFAVLLLKLVPSLQQALHSFEHVSWEWVVGALALEVLVRERLRHLLAMDLRSGPRVGARHAPARTSTHAAWAQLGGGMVVPGGSLASIGVGAWILRRFGMPPTTIAERQFNLSFLNTAVDALALVVFGLGLATGILARGEQPAADPAAGDHRRSRSRRRSSGLAARGDLQQALGA